MSNSDGRMFDEFAKLMNDAAGFAQSARREVETAMRSQADRFVSEMDLVRREDLDIVKEIAAKALAEVERLTLRVAELEARAAAPAKTAAKKSAPDAASGGA